MSFLETNGELTGPHPTQFKVDSFSKDRLELMVRFCKKLWSGFVGSVRIMMPVDIAATVTVSLTGS